MRKFSAILFVIVVIGISFFSFSTRKNKSESPGDKSLIIYAYDSFVSEWGPGPKIFPAFEDEYGIEVTVISAGDAGQVLQRAVIEKDNVNADLLIGIDNNLLSKALAEDILSPYKSANLAEVPEELIFDKTYSVTPFDYGYFSIIYDSEKITVPPKSLADLIKPEYKKSIIFMDPRTSSPGLGFMLWTKLSYGDDFAAFWKALMPSVLTITDGWDSGYGLFTEGEAPMVLSYTTSPAYHAEYEDTDRYRSAVFPSGHYMQIEGISIVKNARHREAAEKFIDFILEAKIQKEIPLTNWMYPVRQDINLPESFNLAPKPEISLILDSELIDSNLDKWIDDWTDAVTK
jgi:thiamine transport system substrate-binding protein